MNLTLSHRSVRGGIGSRRTARFLRAFTLIELLAVIAIIAILASLAGPIIAKFGAGDKLSVGGRQLLDDLAFARSKAMATRSTVYVVFLSPDIHTINLGLPAYATNYLDRVAITNASAKTYSGYALYSERSVGDQPGAYSPRYLMDWKELPAGVSIHPDQFYTNTVPTALMPIKTNYVTGQYVVPFGYRDFPFPNAKSGATFSLPYLAFNAMGQLVGGQNFRIQVSEARITRLRDPENQNALILGPSTITPDAPNTVFMEWETNGVSQGVNYTNMTVYAHEIEINWLTGRGKFLQPEIQ
jgi:prepilin-type N-terminal cleavage/methylation domain-containing protein